MAIYANSLLFAAGMGANFESFPRKQKIAFIRKQKTENRKAKSATEQKTKISTSYKLIILLKDPFSSSKWFCMTSNVAEDKQFNLLAFILKKF